MTSGIPTLSDYPEQVIAPELGSGEKILWSGKPRRGIFLRGSDSYLIPFSLMWGGFAFFWEYMAVFDLKAPFFFKLWGIPFVLAGLYMMVGRFFFEARQRAKTFYAVTNQRVMIVSGLFSREVKSLNLRTLTDLSLSHGSAERGTIYFGNPGPWSAVMGSWPGSKREAVPCFDSIENARQVYEIVRSAQNQS